MMLYQKTLGRRKALYLCFSSKQAAEMCCAHIAQGASMEKSAEMLLYQKNLGPRKVLYLCFSSERVAEAYIRYAAQHEPMEKSAEMMLYGALNES
jgi:hypothetical protein